MIYFRSYFERFNSSHPAFPCGWSRVPAIVAICV